MKKVISSYAEEILRRLVAAGSFPLDGEGRPVHAGRPLPARVTRALTAAGLMTCVDGRARPSPAARPFLRRRAAMRGEKSDGPPAPPMAPAISPYRRQHMMLSAPRRHDGRRPVPLTNHAESPLQRLARLKDRRGRRWFTPGLIAAGERLRTDFELAGLRPRMTIRYEPIGPDRRKHRWREGTLPERMLDARRRFDRALADVGPGLRDVLIAVCCHLEGLEEVERRREWPQRSAKLVLRLALERLADHYAREDGRRPESPPSRDGDDRSISPSLPRHAHRASSPSPTEG